MPRSEEELAEALAQSEAWMDAVNPGEVSPDATDDRRDLRQIGLALISIEAAEQALVSAVAKARGNKRSWTDIANVLGVSRQAARQRFDSQIARSNVELTESFWVHQIPEAEPGARDRFLLCVDLPRSPVRARLAQLQHADARPADKPNEKLLDALWQALQAERSSSS